MMDTNLETGASDVVPAYIGKEGKLGRTFLKQISMYVDDMRVLNNIYNARQGISYPIQVELIIATIFFQLFRLAGTRNVSGNNNALLMVGSIIIGQVSVTSGIIGQEVLLICAISTISTYVISDNLSFNTSIFTFQSIIFLSSIFLGLIGFFISSFLVLLYISDINFYQTNFINFQGIQYYLRKWRKSHE